MKAKEVFRLYESGRRDFRGLDLRGQSFKNHDLSGSDFSEANILGADFTNAFLRGANFSRVNCGLRKWQAAILTISAWLLSGMSGFFLGYSANLIYFISSPSLIQQVSIIPGLAALIVLVAFLVITYRRGIVLALSLSVIAVAAVSSILTSFVASAVVASASLLIAGALTITIAGVASTAVSVAMTIAVAGKVSGIITVACILIFATMGLLANLTASATGLAYGIILVTLLTIFSCYIGWKAFYRETRPNSIVSIAIAWASLGGTSFRNTDLTYSNFTHAKLKGVDFRNSRLSHVNWHAAKQLEQARVGNTILSNLALQRLLVTKNGHNQSYLGANLQGADLQHADLRDANLKRVDLSGANLTNANLSGANLTEILAIGSNFSQTNLTAACIQNWNIDATTIFDDIECEYIFLREGADPLGNRERRPQDPSQTFVSGEFTKFIEGVKEVRNIIDLSFSQGVDWQAFLKVFNQLQTEVGDTEFEIQSLEKRGNNNIVLRLSVPSETDKSEIHRLFVENYQLAIQDLESKYKAALQAKDRETEIYQKQSEDLRAILENLASKPVIIDSEQRNAEK